MAPKYLQDEALEASWVVANNAMNRQRGIYGANSYSKDLRFDVLGFLEARLERQQRVVWVDLCCGSGRALVEAGRHFAQRGLAAGLAIWGLDLVDTFAPIPEGLELRLLETPLRLWEAPEACDLLTCVHGLHYIGDKLGLLTQAASWLTPDGLLLAHLDKANVRSARGTGLARQLTRAFEEAQIDYHPRHRLLSLEGRRTLEFPFEYLGSRDDAGPNFTGQPAVHSYYRRL